MFQLYYPSVCRGFTKKVYLHATLQHLVKVGVFYFSFGSLVGEVMENQENFHKTNVLHNDLKKDAINELGIKYRTANRAWIKFQEKGNSFYANIEEKE